MAKLDTLPVHVYEVDEEVDKDEVGLLVLEDSLETYQHVSKTGIGMFLETGEEFFFFFNVLFDWNNGLCFNSTA